MLVKLLKYKNKLREMFLKSKISMENAIINHYGDLFNFKYVLEVEIFILNISSR